MCVKLADKKQLDSCSVISIKGIFSNLNHAVRFSKEVNLEFSRKMAAFVKGFYSLLYPKLTRKIRMGPSYVDVRVEYFHFNHQLAVLNNF